MKKTLFPLLICIVFYAHAQYRHLSPKQKEEFFRQQENIEDSRVFAAGKQIHRSQGKLGSTVGHPLTKKQKDAYVLNTSS